MNRNGFTLLELLIVSVVIGILVSAAVPNLMDAQVKAKTARVKSDFYVLAAAVESYRADHATVLNTDGPFAPGYLERLVPLTTPTAYLNQLPVDPFQPMRSPFLFTEAEAGRWRNRMYIYNRSDAENGASHGGDSQWIGFAWSLSSVGPDHHLHFPYYYFPPGFVMPEWYVYDPSNGVVSGGEIFYRSINASAH
jgi:prepilin-type N-terminal cleavage/methylation domain-containing protein